MLQMFLKNFIIWFILSSMNELKWSALIMVRNILIWFLLNFFKINGILHQSSCIDIPKQNGIAERKNRHLLKEARSLLFFANIPKYFSGDAVLTACYLINRLPTKILNFKTPLDFFSNLFPTYRNFSSLKPRVFRCVPFVYVPSQCRSKLDHGLINVFS